MRVPFLMCRGARPDVAAPGRKELYSRLTTKGTGGVPVTFLIVVTRDYVRERELFQLSV